MQTFNNHIDAALGAGLSTAYAHYIEQIFVALTDGRPEAIRYVIDVLAGKHGAWVVDGSPTPFSEVVK